MQNARAMPLVRRVVNRWMSATIGAFCGAEIPDSQCGFRLLSLGAWNRIPFSCEHFEIGPLRDTVRWLRWWIGIRNELSPYAHRRVVQPRYESTPQDATA